MSDSQAIQYLKDFLRHGPRRIDLLERGAALDGISRASLHRAARDLACIVEDWEDPNGHPHKRWRLRTVTP